MSHKPIDVVQVIGQRQQLANLQGFQNVHCHQQPTAPTVTYYPGPLNQSRDSNKRTRRKPRNYKRESLDSPTPSSSKGAENVRRGNLRPRKLEVFESRFRNNKKQDANVKVVPNKDQEKKKKKSNNKSKSNFEVSKFEFKISPVKVKRGVIFGKKFLDRKPIGLYTFLTPKTSVNTLSPAVFKTDCKNIPKILKLDKPTDTSGIKSERRKYSITKSKKKVKTQDFIKEFAPYLSLEEVNKGLADKTLVRGVIRINPKNFTDAYVNNEDSSLTDYFITSIRDRNRALEGDEVVLEIKPEKEWVNGYKTARVVYISQQVHSRVVVGFLKPSIYKQIKCDLFYPRDKRCPLLQIPSSNIPKEYKKNYKQFENSLFVAKITEWQLPAYAQGFITDYLGESGNLEVESDSILREYCLDVIPFQGIANYIPKFEGVIEKELEKREDFRKECIFTIDPATAKDLDDAVSAEKLPNGNYKIGVHISDASFYLEEGTELDQLVSKKATSIYMVDKVYHMLPEELCLYCSLLPGEDKLSFSVIWEITPEAEIVNTRFTRSVMNSCTKLAYEHVQNVIDNPGKEIEEEDFPPIHNGFNCKDLIDTVNILQSIAVQLREKRMQNGALKIDQVKLSFNLDPLSGEPLDFWKYENMASHRLIEEFMLLANISVAKKIREHFPDIAFLRCHEAPKQLLLDNLKSNLATYGIHVDVSNSGGISASLRKYITDDHAGQCRSIVLNHLTAKCMTRARYFCLSMMESEDDYKHYALSIPIYTHFTSPIRRYADIMVHRLLAASLNYCDAPQWDIDYVMSIAANCNKQKYNAKRAGDASCELFLSFYIEKHSPFIQKCVVVDVKERSFDAIVLNTGSLIRIYKNNLEKDIEWETEAISLPSDQENSSKNDKKQLKVTITFPKTKELPEAKIVVEIFSTIQIQLERKSNSYKLEGNIVRPIVTTVFVRRNSCNANS